jgi:hypothetical protein
MSILKRFDGILMCCGDVEYVDVYVCLFIYVYVYM